MVANDRNIPLLPDRNGPEQNEAPDDNLNVAIRPNVKAVKSQEYTGNANEIHARNYHVLRLCSRRKPAAI